MPSLLEHLTRWRAFNVLVVGDFMVDQFVYGDAERLSRDAPVPVLRVRRTEEHPGGAGAVCLNLTALRGRVQAFGATGDDAEAGALRRALSDAGVNIDGLIVDPQRPTTVKRRLVGLAGRRHGQKMFRLDIESRDPLPEPHIAEILERFDRALPDADVVCLQDHGAGTLCEQLCRPLIERCRNAGKPVLIDPAATNGYEKYRGATAITPNRAEAERASRIDAEAPQNWPRIAQRLLDDLSLETIVLTLDRHGAQLLQRGGSPVLLPTVAREVYDVTGAGDMVLASLSASRANGVDWPEAVQLANIAAGLEVEVLGVEPIPLERLHHAVLLQNSEPSAKTRTIEEALVEVAAHRRQGRTIVFTNGCFDVIHAGHIWMLREAAKFGDALIVGLNDDDSVRRIKGSDRPVNDQSDRAAILSELASVNAVVLFSEDTPRRLIEAIRPDVYVKGADYSREQLAEADLVESWGGRVELVPLLTGRSTTQAIERMRSG